MKRKSTKLTSLSDLSGLITLDQVAPKTELKWEIIHGPACAVGCPCDECKKKKEEQEFNDLCDKYRAHVGLAKTPEERQERINQFRSRTTENCEPPIKKSRCCGRCDGDYDICIADSKCDTHNTYGCRICWPDPE